MGSTKNVSGHPPPDTDTSGTPTLFFYWPKKVSPKKIEIKNKILEKELIL
jgi:hypothetical protein